MEPEVIVLSPETEQAIDATVRTRLEASVDSQLPDVIKSRMAVVGTNDAPDVIRSLFVNDAGSIRVGEMGDPYKAYTDDTRGVGYAQYLRAFAAADGDPTRAKGVLEGWETERQTPQGQRTLKAMNETNYADGGAFVQQQYSNEYIALLRNKTIVRKAGARLMPMPGGNMSIGKITSGANSYWRGEGDSATSSQLGTGSLEMRSKELVTQIPISKKLLKHSYLQFDIICRDDAVQSGAVSEDSAFLRGPGTQHTPKGIRYLASTTNVFQPGGATIADVDTVYSNAVLKLTDANINMTNPTWMMSHRSEQYLMRLRDTGNGYAFRAEMMAGKWGQFPYFASNQLPNNLGGGGNESEIYLVDMFEFFIGDDGAIEVALEKNVSYKDANGVLVSAFDRGEVVVQVVQSTDCDVRYDKAIAVVNQVTWGA